MASKRRFDKLNGRFFPLPHELIDSPAYADLSGAAVKLLIALGRRHNGRNNGEISFSVREATVVLKSGKDKAYKTFWELWKHGFIVYTTKGTFTKRQASTYFLTFISDTGAARRNDWKLWPNNEANISEEQYPLAD